MTTTNYTLLIETKYIGAKADDNFTVCWMPDPDLVQLPYVDEETGQVVVPDNSGVPIVPVITLWQLPDPQPTIAELDEYAASASYLASWGTKVKAGAEVQINAWANAKVIEFKILIDELFYVAMIANIGFLNTKWIQLGRPTNLDPLAFVCIHSEAQAYRDAHVGQADFESQISAYQLAGVQEAKWQDMQNGFAGIVYARRLALEQIKLAQISEGLEALLADIVAGLDITLGQTMQNLAAQQAALIAQQSEV
jgi:hypothetical protein